MQRQRRRSVIANQTFFAAFAGAGDGAHAAFVFSTDNGVITAFTARNVVAPEVVELDSRANLSRSLNRFF
ncbi:MAG: hypothetical protein M3384_20480 [Acidobacteriota bacterium]|nr:hypothetical protein [Acidobacteriota bacterium]